MKLSTSLLALTFALSGMVGAMPSPLELAAQSSNNCIFASTNEGRCDTQGCRDGGGRCEYKNRECVMNAKMRGKNEKTW
ncbi:hypothetical protein BJ912DRAFT_963981 [Pholiota molesta]|nr:hypothetical protein BJ912DRAFT_987129 [Pholiota molesta]KAF8191335.1 hypothetical protein BJ912DRAFT_963981 [Pholiota molesta]